MTMAKKELHFVHIPKTAGTYIEDLGFMNGYHWGRHNLKFHKRFMKDGYIPAISDDHVPLKNYKNQNVLANIAPFCVYRHPIKRAVSAYTHYMGRLMKQPNKITKNDMNLFFHKLPSHLAKNKYAYNAHFIPQHEYIYDDNGVQVCQYIIDFDNLQQGLRHVFSKHGVNMDKWLHDKVKFSLRPEITCDDLDDESIHILNEMYAKDFDIRPNAPE